MQSIRVLPRLSVVDGRLLRQCSRSIWLDISKSDGWAMTVMEKAPDGQLRLVNNARGYGKTYAMNTMLEIMKQYNIDAAYYAAAALMWAPPKI